MSEDVDQNSKTQEPTERRVHDAFEEGQFAHAPEIEVVAILSAAYGAFLMFGKSLGMQVSEQTAFIFSHLSQWELNEDTVCFGLMQGITQGLSLTLPIMMACFLAAISAGGMQTQFRLTPKVLQLKWSRLNPIAGFKRLFSADALIRFVIDLLKFIVIGGVLYAFIISILDDPIFHFKVPVIYIGDFVFNISTAFLGRLISVLGIVAAVNYFYQKRKVMKDLRMTLQELKEEHKMMEMSPELKSARRKMAKKLLTRQMLDQIPLADVIVTNPTHYAVVLKYERGKDDAPIILAKGENQFAKRIIAIGLEHQVPRIENPPVARLLYKFGKVGNIIPFELYQLVAEILAYVYKTHKYYFHRLKAKRMHTPPNSHTIKDPM